jgi:hypothetical protein
MEKININYLPLFNKHFLDFLSDIESVFPEDVDIKTAKNSVIFLQKSNPSLLLKLWKSHINVKYQDTIDKGDIDFFIYKDYNKDLVKSSNSEQINLIISRLREPISKMSIENKNKTIKYIQNLSKLANLYNI